MSWTSNITSSQNPSPSLSGPPITVFLTLVLLLFFFIGFLSIFWCRCFMVSIVNSWRLHQSLSGNPTVNPASTNNARLPGLDPSLIQIFPSFLYSSVNEEFRREKCGVECAICLGEFANDDLLRLLTVCYHVFHQECVDLWFECHKTCPVCRRDLDLPRETLKIKNLVLNHSINDVNNGNNVLPGDAMSIEIREEGNIVDGQGGNCEEVPQDSNRMRNEASESTLPDRLSRSNSTGHSTVENRVECDHPHSSGIMNHKRRHTTTSVTCVARGDFSISPRHGGLEDVSYGSHRNIDRVSH